MKFRILDVVLLETYEHKYAIDYCGENIPVIEYRYWVQLEKIKKAKNHIKNVEHTKFLGNGGCLITSFVELNSGDEFVLHYKK